MRAGVSRGGPATVVTGGTGFVGRFIVERLLAGGHRVAVTGRTPPPEGFFTRAVDFVEGDLGDTGWPDAALRDADLLVHAAFNHVPGRYRGGEGGDPDGFRRRNLAGTVALFEAAKRSGVARAVFLSSRAVYGSGHPPGTVLDETMAPRPDTLYGAVKRDAERFLADLSEASGFCGASLRVTGVYGPAGKGRDHKWKGLLRDYLEGREIAARAGTEVHGEDVARAVALLLECPAEAACGKAFNVSDVTVDTRDILGVVKQARGISHPLPPPADRRSIHAMATGRLEALGWRPGGTALFTETVRRLALELAG